MPKLRIITLASLGVGMLLLEAACAHRGTLKTNHNRYVIVSVDASCADANVLMDPVEAYQGGKLTWLIDNSDCKNSVKIVLTDFKKRTGVANDPLQDIDEITKPGREVTVSPYGSDSINTRVKKDAETGLYKYTMIVNKTVKDPELMIKEP